MIVCSNPRCQTAAGCQCGRAFPGAYIPIETTAAAWEQIAEERLSAVETYKKMVAELDADNDRLRTALREIVSIRDDTLGPRGPGLEPAEGREHFDRGCRMAFYRCAGIAETALRARDQQTSNTEES